MFHRYNTTSQCAMTIHGLKLHFFPNDGTPTTPGIMDFDNTVLDCKYGEAIGTHGMKYAVTAGDISMLQAGNRCLKVRLDFDVKAGLWRFATEAEGLPQRN